MQLLTQILTAAFKKPLIVAAVFFALLVLVGTFGFSYSYKERSKQLAPEHNRGLIFGATDSKEVPKRK